MNIFLILIGIVLIWRVVEGFRVGMVREIISFVSLIVMAVGIALLGVALSSYREQDMIKMIIALILFLVLCILHRIINFVFFSAKVISKLPVVHGVDRLLGGVIGVMETVIVVWVLFFLIMQFGLGVLGQQIVLLIQENKILTWLYEHNYLAYWIGIISEKISGYVS